MTAVARNNCINTIYGRFWNNKAGKIVISNSRIFLVLPHLLRILKTEDLVFVNPKNISGHKISQINKKVFNLEIVNIAHLYPRVVWP